MKIKVKDTIEREIEITFPSYWEVNKFLTKPQYYVFFSEHLGLFIAEGYTYRVSPILSDINFKELIPADKLEVWKVFKANQKLFDTTMQGITVDLNSNTTTEDLEQINK